MRRFAVLAFLMLVWSAGAHAQSSPGFVPGQVVTAQQLNSAFQLKQDYSPTLSSLISLGAGASNCQFVYFTGGFTLGLASIGTGLQCADGVLSASGAPGGIWSPSVGGTGVANSNSDTITLNGPVTFGGTISTAGGITLGGQLTTAGALTVGNLTTAGDLLMVIGSQSAGQVPMSGDGTINSSGVLDIGNLSHVTNGSLQPCPVGSSCGASIKITATGTVAVQSAQTVIWDPTSPAAVTFTLALAPVDNYCQSFVNASQQVTYPLQISGNGNDIGPAGATTAGFFGNGSARYCYSSAAGYWSQS